MFSRPMHCCPTNVLPAVVHPTKCCVNHTCTNNVVPHIHPTHTTTVNHINFQNQHYFPHTQSSVNQVTSTNVGPFPGMPPFPTQGATPFPGGSGMMNPGMMNPGMMNPGMNQGFFR